MKLRRLYERFYQWLPLLMGLACIALSQILAFFPEVADTIYRRGFFAAFRWVNDATLAWLPFPVITLLLMLFTIWVIYRWYKRRIFIYRPWYRGIANFLGIMITWFYLAWGFNYAAPGIAETLDIQADELNPQAIEVLWKSSTQQANLQRSMADTSLFFTTTVREKELNAIHIEVREYLNASGIATPGLPKMRLVSLNGWMRRIGITGIYFPFSSECHADASYPALQQWFTIAHEYAHGYGITDEGECNFIAFMALQNSKLAHLNYAAWFDLAFSLKRSEEDYTSHSAMWNDRMVLREMALSYPPLFPELSRATNDLYLKANGVEDGIVSYQKSPQLIYAIANKGYLRGKVKSFN